MSGLTKEELKTALINHGIEIPGSGSKKEEYMALYEEFIVGKRRNGSQKSSAADDSNAAAGELFSDEEDVAVVKSAIKKSPTKKQQNILTEGNSLIVDGFNIAELTDEELFSHLKKNGVDVGPIVDSTRAIYRKKLAILLRGSQENENEVQQTNGNHETNGKTNGDAAAAAEFSAGEEALDLQLEADTGGEDEDVIQPASKTKKVSRKSVASRKSSRSSKIASTLSEDENTSPKPSLRQRITSVFDSSPSKKDRFTPTPRRSIHTYKVTEKTTETMTKSGDGSVTRDFNYTKETSTGSNIASERSFMNKLIRFLPKLFLTIIIVVVSYYVYKNYLEGHDISSEVEKALNWAKKSASSSSFKPSTTPTPPIVEKDPPISSTGSKAPIS